MYEQSDKIITSFFAGAGGAFAGAAIFVNFFGIPIENPGSIPFAIVCGILTMWLTYRIKCSHSYNELCESYPNGVKEWLLDKKRISSIDAQIKNVSYETKKEVLCSHKEIVIKEQYVRDQYKYLERKYSYGVKEFNPRNENWLKVIAIHKEEEIKKIDSDLIRKRNLANFQRDFEQSQKEYPLGTAEWLRLNQAQLPLNPTLLEKFWQERTKIKDYDQIKKDEKTLTEWKTEQKVFSGYCRDLHDNQLEKFGCYNYDISISYKGARTSHAYTIWQHFAHSFCHEEDMDYSNFKGIKRNADRVKQGKLSISDKIAEKIANFIKELDSKENTSIYFCPPENNEEKGNLESLYMRILSHFDNSVDSAQIFMPSSNIEKELSKWYKKVQRRIVIIDLATENSRLIQVCSDIIKKIEDKRPLLSFISIYKGYDREEMQELIDEEDSEKAQEEENKKIREQVRKHLLESVQTWHTLPGGIKYNYLFNYYPTTCDFEATEEEWAHRRLIWDFKNDPDKDIDPERHEHVLKVLIRKLLFALEKEFSGCEYMSYLTLVCLPASTKSKNEARYKDFSQRLCKVTCMENGFDHIHIIKDGLSKNSPENTTGRSIQPIVRFDDWFNDKYVLLFDDVITKGNTMLKYKTMLEKKGATVVGGYALGKTKHVRPGTINSLDDDEITSLIMDADW
jgi:predicted amidophosphoribosyltransferase